MLIYWILGALGSLFYLYVAARLVTRAVLRTMKETLNNG